MAIAKRKKIKEKKYPELNALKGRIREKKTSYRKIAEKLGIAVNTTSDKINGFYAFNASEMEIMAIYLDIEPTDFCHYFLPEYEAKYKKHLKNNKTF